jgi:hypothetical protein
VEQSSFFNSNSLGSGGEGCDDGWWELVVILVGVLPDDDEVDELTDDELVDEESAHSAENEQTELMQRQANVGDRDDLTADDAAYTDWSEPGGKKEKYIISCVHI